MAEDHQLKTAVIRTLQEWGFEVADLPRVPNSRTADLLATRDQRYLIELKERQDDEARLSEAESRLKQGEIVETAEPAGYKNRTSGIICSGVGQLRSHQDLRRDFSLLWLHSSGEYPDVKMRQFWATLYGITNIYDLEGDSYHRPCFYFHDSDFFRHRRYLDGAILTSISGAAQLCINDHSARADTLRKSSLAEKLAEVLVDPAVDEAQGAGYIADTDIDRKDSDAVLRYLRRKYGRDMLDKIELGYMSFTGMAPSEGNGDDEDR